MSSLFKFTINDTKLIQFSKMNHQMTQNTSSMPEAEKQDSKWGSGDEVK